MRWKREGTKVSEQLMLRVKDESAMTVLRFQGIRLGMTVKV